MLLIGDALTQLQTIPNDSIHCCVTSPPYWGLRAYLPEGHPDKAREIGAEKTPELFVEHIVKVFREVRRVLHPSGTLWLNLGDSYAGGGNQAKREGDAQQGVVGSRGQWKASGATRHHPPSGLKEKDLVGIPWMVAFALRADGWWLRSDIVWSKLNPMPESVKDRPTRSHEYIFLLAKSQRYFYDQDAIREPHKESSLARYKYGLHMTADPDAIEGSLHDRVQSGLGNAERMGDFVNPEGRNKRSVWTINTRPYPEAHFATFPPTLPEICIRAGTSEKGCCPTCKAPWDHEGDDWKPTCKCPEHEPEPCVVLDPFSGAGTTLMVATELRRKFIGIELNPEYAKLIDRRLDKPLTEEARRQAFDDAMAYAETLEE